MTKKRKPILATFLFILFFLPSLLANQIPDELNNLILKGKEYFYQFNITRAQAVFDQIINKYPEYPQGYFYQTYLTFIIFSQDMTNDSLAKELDEQVNGTVDIANKYKKNLNGDIKRIEADAEFYLGASYGLKAMNYVIDRNYLGGYWFGRKAKGHLEDVIKIDSTYYDAYLGLGIFHYYVDLLPGIIQFIAGILGFDGDKNRGRNEVLMTSQSGKHFKVEAYLTYYVIRYFLEGEKRQSLQKFLELHHKYPSNVALSVILAYHYRRFGYMKKCIQYCESVPDSFITILPQIVDIKYYNLAVSRYDMNMYFEADSLFNLLIQLPTRKSLYYQSAIKFYKGMLAALKYDRDAAVYYLKNIFKHKQTKYWYYQAQMYLKYSMDSLMHKEIYARNLLYSRQFDKGLEKALELKYLFDIGETSKNPDMRFLIMDLLAENYYYGKDYQLALKVYKEIAPDMDDIEDDYQRSWIHIHYARCLRKVSDYDNAEKMLKEAHDLDDDFTRLIIERERYIIGQEKQNNGNKKG
jgi:tetratricopeptide (TPR) repeat protein